MTFLTKKEQERLVTLIIANAIIAQDAIQKANLPVHQFTDAIDTLVYNTTSAVVMVNGQDGLDTLQQTIFGDYKRLLKN